MCDMRKRITDELLDKDREEGKGSMEKRLQEDEMQRRLWGKALWDQ